MIVPKGGLERRSARALAPEQIADLRQRRFRHGLHRLFAVDPDDLLLRLASIGGSEALLRGAALGTAGKEQSRILQQHPPHPVRKGQRPLPVGHVRQHVLHQVHRRDVCPLRVTGGTHSSSLARKGVDG
jgi:hypothetical protein